MGQGEPGVGAGYQHVRRDGEDTGTPSCSPREVTEGLGTLAGVSLEV